MTHSLCATGSGSILPVLIPSCFLEIYTTPYSRVVARLDRQLNHSRDLSPVSHLKQSVHPVPGTTASTKEHRMCSMQVSRSKMKPMMLKTILIEQRRTNASEHKYGYYDNIDSMMFVASARSLICLDICNIYVS